MDAMVLREFCEIGMKGEPEKKPGFPRKENPLDLLDLPRPVPVAKQLLIKVSACGICHTELDEIEGRLVPPKFPVVLGHEIVGRVDSCGSGVTKFRMGDRVGVAWIYSSCGQCKFCQMGNENLCDHFKATGLDANGGYAQHMVVSGTLLTPFPRVSLIPKPRLFFAPVSSATGPSGSRE